MSSPDKEGQLKQRLFERGKRANDITEIDHTGYISFREMNKVLDETKKDLMQKPIESQYYIEGMSDSAKAVARFWFKSDLEQYEKLKKWFGAEK